ncbi:MAG: hypothetical protein II956_14445 [Bacteroidales bacterium]|nr:hypothetical protein [Bacteroidales bacterium]
MDIKSILKAYFKKNAYPTEEQYAALIEAFITSDELDKALEEYVKKNAETTISETLTLTGSKKLFFRQDANADKPGFTVYNADGSEAAFFEYKNANGTAVLALGNYLNGNTKQYTETLIGFKIQDTKTGFYGIFAPKIAAAKHENPDLSMSINAITQFFLPLKFKVGDIEIKTSEGGTVDLTEAIKQLLQNGNI